MPLKNILIHLDHTRGSETRLALGLEWARITEAHITAIALVGEVYFPTMAGVSLPPQLLDEQIKAAEERAKEVLDAARKQAEQAGIAIETRHETAVIDRLPFVFARHARHADVAIVGQPDPEQDDLDATLLAEAAFMDSGRPALVIPYTCALRALPEKILVAWDGSREAVRAVNDALPFLEHAKAVTLLVIDPNRYKDRLGEDPGADMATQLARHNINVTLKTTKSEGLSVAETLQSEAQTAGAEIIVMGGYGHSRLREVLIGGVTHSMLNNSPIALMLSH